MISSMWNWLTKTRRIKNWWNDAWNCRMIVTLLHIMWKTYLVSSRMCAAGSGTAPWKRKRSISFLGLSTYSREVMINWKMSSLITIWSMQTRSLKLRFLNRTIAKMIGWNKLKSCSKVSLQFIQIARKNQMKEVVLKIVSMASLGIMNTKNRLLVSRELKNSVWRTQETLKWDTMELKD